MLSKRCLGLAFQNLNAHDEHGFEESIGDPVIPVRLADRFKEVESGCRFGSADRFILSAAERIAFAFKLAAPVAATEAAVDASTAAFAEAVPATAAVKFACAIASAFFSWIPAMGLTKLIPRA